jgi:hypothetical protein
MPEPETKSLLPLVITLVPSLTTRKVIGGLVSGVLFGGAEGRGAPSLFDFKWQIGMGDFALGVPNITEKPISARLSRGPQLGLCARRCY